MTLFRIFARGRLAKRANYAGPEETTLPEGREGGREAADTGADLMRFEAGVAQDQAGDRDAAVQAMTTASRQLDKAASKGVIHKNQAANRKSAMAKRAASL